MFLIKLDQFIDLATSLLVAYSKEIKSVCQKKKKSINLNANSQISALKIGIYAYMHNRILTTNNMHRCAPITWYALY